jgi:hypothetical protein
MHLEPFAVHFHALLVGNSSSSICMCIEYGVVALSDGVLTLSYHMTQRTPKQPVQQQQHSVTLVASATRYGASAAV